MKLNRCGVPPGGTAKLLKHHAASRKLVDGVRVP